MKVVIVAEDEANEAIAKRLVRHCLPDEEISFDVRPKRKGKIRDYLRSFNEIAKDEPVLILFDLDQNNCPKDLLKTYFSGVQMAPGLLFRTPVTEAESWLLADRQGLAKYLKVSVDGMPDVFQPAPKRRPKDREIKVATKPSLKIMELAAESESDTIRELLRAEEGSSKSKLYNTALTPFIERKWNINRAMKNSYSLERSVRRICAYLNSIPQDHAH